MNWEPTASQWSWDGRRSPDPGGGSWPPGPRPPDVAGDDRPVARRSTEQEAVSPVDLELIEVLCRVMASDSRCTLCDRGLSASLKIELHDSELPDRAWVASVSSRCRGWGRHRNKARVWLSDDALHLQPFAVRV